jgi:hypothetical protein
MAAIAGRCLAAVDELVQDQTVLRQILDENGSALLKLSRG